MLREKGLHFYTVILLFLLYLVNGFLAIPQNSVTYDEMDHWSYGKRILKREPQKIYPYDDASAMPVSGLNALPRAVEQLAHPSLKKTDAGFSDIMHGRYVTVFLCLLTGIFIYRWSAELFGKNAGLLSLFLYVFCPNLNAHTSLLTTDAYTALFTIVPLYFFWKFVKESGWKWFLLFTVSLGLAQLVKQSLLHLFILLCFCSWVILIRRKTVFSRLKTNLARLLVLLLMVTLIINLGFFFRGTGHSLSQYELHSRGLKNLQTSFAGKIPLAIPVPFISGLDMTLYMNELGAGDPDVSNKNYLWGEERSGTGFWNYYLVTGFFKTPLSVLLMALGLPFALFRRKEKVDSMYTLLFLGGGIIYFLINFSLFNNVQIGIRHILLVFPLLYVMLGYWATVPWKKGTRNSLVALLLIYSLVTYYRFYPNLISYHNELVADRKVYRIMGDSNIDYGQSLFRYNRYRQLHPEIKVPGTMPGTGRFIVSPDAFTGVDEKNAVPWLSANFEPDGIFDHCYLLFTVTEEDLREKGLK